LKIHLSKAYQRLSVGNRSQALELVYGYPRSEQVRILRDPDIRVFAKPAHFGLNANPARHLQVGVRTESIEPVRTRSGNAASGIVRLECGCESPGSKRNLSPVSRGRNLRMCADTDGENQKGQKKKRNSSHGKGACPLLREMWL